MDRGTFRLPRKDAVIDAHPLSALLRSAARGAHNANAIALTALADVVDAPSPMAAEALCWFDTTVHLVDGRYEPCAPVRRRLRGLTSAEDPAQTIARLAAEELTTRAVVRERSCSSPRSGAPFPRYRG